MAHTKDDTMYTLPPAAARRPGASRQALATGPTLSLAVILLFAGCASLPPPTEQMAVSRAAISNALSAGGNQYAPVVYKSAVDKMQAAEAAMPNEDYVLALRLAQEAEVDARLAAETARAAKAQKAADAVQDDMRVLRKEMNRNATTDPSAP